MDARFLNRHVVTPYELVQVQIWHSSNQYSPLDSNLRIPMYLVSMYPMETNQVPTNICHISPVGMLLLSMQDFHFLYHFFGK